MKRGTPDHPKTVDLSDRLGIPIYGAVGLLELLWHFTAEFCPQGDVGRFPDVAIARACYWKKGPDRLIQALVDSGWLDVDQEYRLLVHDWADHMDETTRKKLLRRHRQALTGSRKNPKVYVIQAMPSGNLKIGFTVTSVQARLEALQTGSHEVLTIFAEFSGSRQTENRIHKLFSHLRLNREWFRCDVTLVDFIKDRCNSVRQTADVSQPLVPTNGNVDAIRVCLPEPLPEPNTPHTPPNGGAHSRMTRRDRDALQLRSSRERTKELGQQLERGDRS